MPEPTTVSGPLVGGNAGKADALNASFDAAVKGVDFSGSTFAKAVSDKTPDPEPVVTEPVETETENAPPVETEAKAETAEEKAQRIRDEKGRFAKEGEPAPKVADKNAAPTSTDMSAPAHWDAGTKDAFGKLKGNPEAQKAMMEVAKRFEGAYTRKTTELAEDRKFATSVKSLIRDDHKAQLRQVGMSEIDGIAHLLKLNDYATKDPRGYVKWVMERANIDPRELVPESIGEQSQGEQAPQLDPRLTQLQQTVQTLQQREALRERQAQAEAQRREQEQLSSAGDVIAKFRNAANEGVPTHPHFDELQDDIAQLCASHPRIKSIPDMSERLAAAYEVAVYARPDLRTSIVDSEMAKREAAKRQQDDVNKARRAAPAVRSVSTTAVKGKPKSLDEVVRSAISGSGV